MRPESLIHPDEEGLRVNPFVARGRKRIVTENVGRVGWRDQGDEFGRDRAKHRIASGHLIRQTCDGQPGRRVKTETIPHWNATHRSGGGGIINLAYVDRPNRRYSDPNHKSWPGMRR